MNGVQTHCLLLIYRLSEKGQVRSLDLVREQNVGKSTVNQRLKVLYHKGLIQDKRFQNITLTEKGVEAALEVKERYEAIYPFFREVLELQPREAEQSVFIFLEQFSDECIRSLVFKLPEMLRLYPSYSKFELTAEKL